MIATPAWPPRSLPRLYVEPPLSTGIAVGLDAGQANYLGNVLRLKECGEVLLFDGVSGEWLARVVEAGKRRMILAVVEPTRAQEAVPDLALAFAPVKKGRVDWLVEKAVELGVARLEPVITRRTIVDKLNLERMRAHIVEAAEQCGRTALATSQSTRPFLIGAKASARSGTASCSRVRSITARIIRRFPASTTRASHSPDTPSNSNTSPPSFKRSTLPR